MKLVILFAAYITASIVTYGHAFHQVGSTYIGENAVGALVSSFLWPLYWSVQAWK